MPFLQRSSGAANAPGTRTVRRPLRQALLGEGRGLIGEGGWSAREWTPLDGGKDEPGNVSRSQCCWWMLGAGRSAR
jgi:hypothetical protein